MDPRLNKVRSPFTLSACLGQIDRLPVRAPLKFRERLGSPVVLTLLLSGSLWGCFFLRLPARERFLLRISPGFVYMMTPPVHSRMSCSPPHASARGLVAFRKWSFGMPCSWETCSEDPFLFPWRKIVLFPTSWDGWTTQDRLRTSYPASIRLVLSENLEIHVLLIFPHLSTLHSAG